MNMQHAYEDGKSRKIFSSKPSRKEKQEDVQIRGQRQCEEKECEGLGCIRLTQDMSVWVWTASD